MGKIIGKLKFKKRSKTSSYERKQRGGHLTVPGWNLGFLRATTACGLSAVSGTSDAFSSALNFFGLTGRAISVAFYNDFGPFGLYPNANRWHPCESSAILERQRFSIPSLGLPRM